AFALACSADSPLSRKYAAISAYSCPSRRAKLCTPASEPDASRLSVTLLDPPRRPRQVAPLLHRVPQELARLPEHVAPAVSFCADLRQIVGLDVLFLEATPLAPEAVMIRSVQFTASAPAVRP